MPSPKREIYNVESRHLYLHIVNVLFVIICCVLSPFCADYIFHVLIFELFLF